MNTFERRNKIVEMVNTKGSVTSNDLASEFAVSGVTIRADLHYLEKKGLLIRFHGGAAQNLTTVQALLTEGKELSLTDRYELASDPKERIAIQAASLVQEGDTIILDSGSTTKLVAEKLMVLNNITVITNSLAAASVLAENRNITLVVCGGTLRHKTLSLHGRITELSLQGVSAKLMFVGADGLDSQNGITTFNEGYAVSSLMAAAAQQVIVVTDSTKFGRKGLSTVLPIEKIDVIITDKEAPKQEIGLLIKMGKKVLLA
ncbi:MULTISPECIES: DeoR/GlpR family DNA-binding transcription regulator [Enterobacterales]|uniref:DeoR/GlpR family DNA-binding transcription regulator n=1 Tax=Enterobacterales TaxID=91347 RepID=UPI002EDACBE2